MDDSLSKLYQFFARNPNPRPVLRKVALKNKRFLSEVSIYPNPFLNLKIDQTNIIFDRTKIGSIKKYHARSNNDFSNNDFSFEQ